MRKHYLRNLFFLFVSLFIINACQHFSESKKVVINKDSNTSKTVNSAKKTDEKLIVKENSITKASTEKFTTKTSENTSLESQVFQNFGDSESQNKLRSELLKSISKDGDFALSHRKTKAERVKKFGAEKSGIEEMAEYRKNITMPIGTDKMLYEEGYLMKEYQKALKSPILARAKNSRFKSATAYSVNNVIWKERGPNNIPGRDRVTKISPTNPDKWYVGTAGGGVWITENAGTSWRNTTDYTVPSLATSTLGISSSDPNVIYAGSGEPYGNLDALTGVGVIKSTDAGETWTYLSNTASFGSVGRVLVNPTNSNHVIVGTSTGIYVSTNGGTSWSQTLTGTGTTTNTQDIVSTNDFSAIYAAVNTYGVMKSVDGGTTWTRVFDAPSKAKSIKRIELSVAPTDNNRIFLSTEAGTTVAFYISDDAGATFTELTYATSDSKEILSTQGWYDNMVTTNPFNKNIVYVGGVYLAKLTIDTSANTYSVLQIASGYDTTKLNDHVHPDQHGLVCQVNPNNPAQFRMILTNDGGVYYTTYKSNPGETEGDWIGPVTGLNTTQFYGADKKKNEDSYIAGAQDNGSSATITSPSGTTSNYKALFGGDGFEVLWNYNNPNKLLFGSQYNNFITSLTGINGTLYYARNADYGSTKSPFYSKLANANNNPDVVFTVSSSGVWRSPNFGSSWSLSTFNTTNNGTWLGNASYATVKVSVANPNVVWAASAVSGGAGTTYKVNLSKDNGLTFAKTTNTSFPTTGNYYISGLATSNINEATAYVLFSATNQPKVVKTTDFGSTWVDISGFDGTNTTSLRGFPNVSVHSLLEMPFDTNVLWAGTDIGVFETVDGGNNWYLVTAFPPVSVWNMKIVDNQVVLATHGRGVWTAEIPELNTYALPTYIGPPTIKSARQAGIHNNKISAVFNYTNSEITSLKIYQDDVFVNTISSTLPNTDYTYTSVTDLSEGVHKISVRGVYQQAGVDKETILANANVEIINFNAGAANVNIPTFTTSDVYIGGGKFVVDKGANKFTYNVLNNVDHPYANNTTYSTYLKTPIVVGANSNMTMSHMALTEKDYDFAYIEASKDLVNWTIIGKYDEGAYAEWNAVAASGVTESLFRDSALNLTSKFNTGDEVAIRLRLTTDVADVRQGWYIKSITSNSSLSTVDISKNKEVFLAPNPAKEKTTVILPSNNKGYVDVYLYDAAGKLITSVKKASGEKVDLDVSNLTKGLYLVLVNGDSFKKALKLVKE
ncbi:MAG TPA: hypothetical protein DIT47_09755 [Flavobacteriaceae bacterium]|nr:hypothetical protein [Flavobacteriaceae bacterium]